ncbi:ATP phosphoribosyltransferase regulatory subunit [Caenispirillum salinarum AK4]|uniref:ATP phosphoribosyltransferase regulatory subunit n=1 Tax=Caenispirillum salinarum AK4 TaxID=1238182 RepID=K9HLZ1_9PROT|nr:ATP phosphoribosyltransferase regulatory subunit [Caenispirillum salinarum]EKV31373.1 ATP phosphoribosyltransferase regulatory subunit [Caenispirillum salinarum AK4]
MTDTDTKALLPAGLRDLLPPAAAFEASVVDRLVSHFAGFGFERVKPPLIEFEENLLAGTGAATAMQTFRVMDPMSQRMLGLRADITIQVARIATTRLKNAPRPLRLSYAGQILRVRGSQLHPERQFSQCGIELIGVDSPAADAEVVVTVASALAALGITGLSVDLNLPTLVPAVCDALHLTAEQRAEARTALDQKDAAAVAALGGPASDILGALLKACGSADTALDALRALDLPPVAAAERDRLAQVLDRVRADLPDVGLTVDAVENRGFEYHTGVAFSLFAKGAPGELGRGGRYLAGQEAGSTQEPAVGVTLFVDKVLDVAPQPEARPRLFVPAGTPLADRIRLRDEGWTVVAGLEPVEDALAEARRLDCDHAMVEGAPRAVG